MVEDAFVNPGSDLILTGGTRGGGADWRCGGADWRCGGADWGCEGFICEC